IVDDIEYRHHPALMRGVYEPLQADSASIYRMRTIQQHAVVPPATVARELRHRHELDRRETDAAEMVELAPDPVEIAFGGESAGVELVDDRLFPRAPRPGGGLPIVRRGNKKA